MNIKRYTTRDESAGYVSAEDTELSLQRVKEMTNWSDEEFDKISELKVGQKLNFGGISVERTA